MNQDIENFKYVDIADDAYADTPQCPDLSQLYKRACDDMNLQQSKRDQIILIYVTLCSFLIPMLFRTSGEVQVIDEIKPYILFGVAGIGLLLSFIIIRYRIYKEAYLLTILTLYQLYHLKTKDAINKENIERIYYGCMKNKWYKKYISDKRKYRKKYRKWNIFYHNVKSVETLYFLLIALLTAISVGLFTFIYISRLDCSDTIQNILLFGVIISVLCFLLWMYLYYLAKEYAVLKCRDDVDPLRDKDYYDKFRKAFRKAWILHFSHPKHQLLNNTPKQSSNSVDM